MGAPRKYPTKDAAATIERLAADGYAQVGIAKEFGVVASTLKRWMEEDESLREAFNLGREIERRELHGLIKRDAAAGKSANANAMFLLKCRHGYREFDSPSTKVDVAVAVASVMIVKDHGTDQEWAAKVAEQQRRLTLADAPAFPAPETGAEPVGYIPPALAPIAAPAPSYAPPSWHARS